MHLGKEFKKKNEKNLASDPWKYYKNSTDESDNESQEITPLKSKNKPEKKKMKKWVKVLIIVLSVVLVIMLVCLGIFYYYFGGLKTNKLKATDKDLGISSTAKDGTDKVTNIALFGVDTRGNDDSGRSDALMVLSIDEIHNKLKLISIARDTYCTIPGRDSKTKINHAYAYGGPKLAIKTLNTNFNLDIRDYATVNFGQLADIIDKLGGITVQLTDKEIKELNDNCNMNVKVGSNNIAHLNGKQAVSYSRIRNIDSDLVRNERQRTVLVELFEKIKSKSKTEYPGLVKSLLPYVETSYGYTDIMHYAPFMLKNPELVQASLPCSKSNAIGGMYEGAWYFRYDLNEAGKMIHKFIYDNVKFEDQ